MDRLTAQGKAFATSSAAMYTDRATIRRRVVTKAPDGGNLPRDLVLASNVPCRIKPSSAHEKEVAGATQGSTAYTVRMPAWQGSELVDLDSTCFLDIAAREGGPEAQTLSVVAPLPSPGEVLDTVAVRQT